jgi:hypothetical protein
MVETREGGMVGCEGQGQGRGSGVGKQGNMEEHTSRKEEWHKKEMKGQERKEERVKVGNVERGGEIERKRA